MRIRVIGLIKFMNEIRSRLQKPLSEEQAVKLSSIIKENLNDVRSICRKHGGTIKDLPAPSRNAFSYLEKLKIKAGGGEAGQSGRGGYFISGLNGTVTSFLNQLAAADNEEKLTEFNSESRAFLEGISKQLARRGKAFADLPPKQQRLLYRMQLYTEENITDIFPGNAAYFSERIEAGWPAGFFRHETPLVFFTPSNSRMWQIKPGKQGHQVHLSDLYLLTDREGLLSDLAAVICGAAKRRKIQRKNVKEWLRSEAVMDFKGRIEDSLSHDEGAAVGLVYDLNRLFEKINRKYFSGSLVKNGLYWTRSQARCRTGYYNPLSNEIFISAALDSKDVPQYVVEFVLYHEMLHQQQGKDLFLSGRRIHSPAFKKEEQLFHKYHEAEEFLKKLASGR